MKPSPNSSAGVWKPSARSGLHTPRGFCDHGWCNHPDGRGFNPGKPRSRGFGCTFRGPFGYRPNGSVLGSPPFPLLLDGFLDRPRFNAKAYEDIADSLGVVGHRQGLLEALSPKSSEGLFLDQHFFRHVGRFHQFRLSVG